MSDLQNTEQNQTNIPKAKYMDIDIRCLSIHPDNVRKQAASQADQDEMKASIIAHGLIQPLSCVPIDNADDGTPRYGIGAGGRRLKALMTLNDEGKLPADLAKGIPCNVYPAGSDLSEISLAENQIRISMSPADQITAWAALFEKGSSVSDIASRFGVTDGFVSQRLKLSNVIPEVIDLLRQDKISLDVVKAFSIADNQEHQREALAAALETGRMHPYSIRAQLTNDSYDMSDAVAKCVGLKNYKNAGGRVSQDLFTTDDRSIILHDRQIIDDILAKSGETLVKTMLDQGWKWAEFHHSLTTSSLYDTTALTPEPAEPTAAEAQRMAELETILENEDSGEYSEEEIDAAYDEHTELENAIDDRAIWSEEQKAQSGVVICIDHNGDFQYHYGRVTKADQKSAPSSSVSIDGNDSAETAELISQALKDDLGTLKTQIAQAAILKHDTIYWDMIAFNLAINCFDNRYDSVGSITRNYNNLSRSCADLPCAGVIETHWHHLPKDWQAEDTADKRFRAFAALSDQDKANWLRWAAATSYQVSFRTDRSFDSEAQHSVARTLPIDWKTVWRPDAAFWKRIKKPAMELLVAPVLGDQWIKDNGQLKKAALAQRLEDIFAGRANSITSEQASMALNWQVPGFGYDQDDDRDDDRDIIRCDGAHKECDEGEYVHETEPETPNETSDGSVEPDTAGDAPLPPDTLQEPNTALPAGMTMMVLDSHLKPINAQGTTPPADQTDTDDLPAFLR